MKVEVVLVLSSPLTTITVSLASSRRSVLTVRLLLCFLWTTKMAMIRMRARREAQRMADWRNWSPATGLSPTEPRYVWSFSSRRWRISLIALSPSLVLKSSCAFAARLARTR